MGGRVELGQDGLLKLHDALLELLREVDRVCRKNGVEYTLDGGTLLGAVRHGGFIPWDDDADVAFVREEYEKFFDACAKDLDTDRFFLQERRTDPEYPWGYPKLRMNGTRLQRPGQGHLRFHDGIYLDVFVYDNVPDGFFSRRLFTFACFLIRKCQYSAVGKVGAGSAALRAWYSLIDRIPKRFLFASLDSLAASANSRRTRLARHMTYPYPRRECRFGLPRGSFDEYANARFEGEEFRITTDYNRYLTMLYGDYMTPPCESEIKHLEIESIQFPGDAPSR